MITKFEKFNEGYYDSFSGGWGKKWKLSLKKPEFFICLKKVGMPDEKIDYWDKLYKLGTFSKYSKENVEYIILQRSPKKYFTWSPLETYSLIDDASFEYMGELKATQKEIEEWYEEQEAKETAKKYNL